MACAVCDDPTASSARRHHPVCARCRSHLRPAEVRRIPGLDHVCGLVDYDDAGRRLVWALKLRRRRRLVSALADAFAQRLDTEPGLDLAGGVVTWPPTTASHRRDRGFDQAELLARAVARRLRLPVRRLRRHGPAQTGRDAATRWAQQPRFSVAACLDGPALVVDDVVTTGATMAAAADAVRRAGATAVVGAAVAIVA